MFDMNTRKRGMVKRTNAAALFSALSYERNDGLFFFEDQSIGFGFICDPLTYIDDATANKLNVLYGQNYPKNTMLQVMLWASPDIQPVLSDMLSMRDWINQTDEDSPERLLKAIFNKKADHFKQGVDRDIESRNKTRVRDIKVIITIRYPCKHKEPTEEEEKKTKDLKQSCLQVLETSGMQPQLLHPESYLRIMHTMVNWGKDPLWKKAPMIYDETKPIRDQIVDINSVIAFDRNGVWLGNKRVKTLSVKRYPEFIHLVNSMRYLGHPAAGARGLKGSVLITLNTLYPAQEEARAKAEGARNRIIYQNTTGQMSRYVPKLQDQRKSYDELFKAIDDGDRIVKTNMTICLFSDTEEEGIGKESDAATAAVSNAVTYFRELNFQLQEDQFITLPLFLNSLPFGAEHRVVKDLIRYKTMGTRHATQLMPVGAEWKGTGTPVINLVSRNGQLMSIDLYDSSTNYGCVIAAESGSGKSFFCSDIITSYRSIGAHIWCIDAGRSYEKTAKSLNGDFIEFTKDRKICLNPFEIIQDYEEQADILLAVLVAMIAPNDPLSDLEVAKLRSVMKDLWDKHGTKLTIDNLADDLKSQRDDDGNIDHRITDLGIRLFPFTSRGEYGRYFNGPNTISFNNPLTVLELDELKGRPHLQQVVLVQLISQIHTSMYLGNDYDTPKLVIIDEAWDLLTEGSVAKFMVAGFRRFRKYMGAPIILTQSVNDLYTTPGGEAIAENAANKFLLGQTSEAVEQLRETKRLALGDGGYDILKTVHKVDGAYSEIFCYTNNGMGIGRLIVDRFTQLMYTTQPTERRAIMDSVERGMTYEEAILDIIDKEERMRRQPRKVA